MILGGDFCNRYRLVGRVTTEEDDLLAIPTRAITFFYMKTLGDNCRIPLRWGDDV